jgi:O-antigen ligase
LGSYIERNKKLNVRQILRSSTDKFPFAMAALVFIASVAPLVTAYQLPPQPVFINQWIAAALWGSVSILGAWTVVGRRCGVGREALRDRRSAFREAVSARTMLSVFWALLLTSILLSVALSLTPWFIVATSLGVVAIALALCLVVTRLTDQEAHFMWRALLLGLLFAAVINASVALLQAAAPRWYDDVWIAQGQGERAFGNLRQPNLLALVSLWGLLCTLALFRGNTNRWIAAVCALPLMGALWLSGSRAGWLGLLIVVACWVTQSISRDRPAIDVSTRASTARRIKYLLGASLFLVAAVSIAIAVNYFSTSAERTAALSQRVLLWRDVLQLIATEPWSGVGFGQLNFAWTLTPLPHRSQDVFDHAHNLPLHWAVEFGLPIAALLLLLLGATLWQSLRASRSPDRLIMLAMIAVALWHSMAEYPLWFAHFLLPTAAVAALFARASSPSTTSASGTKRLQHDVSSSARFVMRVLLVFVTALFCFVLFFSLQGYRSVAAIYTRAADLDAARAAATHAQQHPLYGYYGDYAKIMIEGDSATTALFSRAPRAIIDEKLLTAWARALEREGRAAEAAYIVARAREFPQDRSFVDLPKLPATGASSVRRAIDLSHFRTSTQNPR